MNASAAAAYARASRVSSRVSSREVTMGDGSPEGSFTSSFKQRNSLTELASSFTGRANKQREGMNVNARGRQRRKSMVEGFRRRAMPAQGGVADERRNTEGGVSDDVLDVMIAGLWKHHRLIAPSQVSTPKFYWDMVVIVAVMWNCFVVPAELCFRRAALNIETTEAGRQFKTFDAIIDIFFFVDIVLNFRTTYFDENGDLEVNWRQIARTYAFQPPYWFWMDALGTIPWDLLVGIFNAADGDASAARAFGMLKLPRLLRLSRLMKNLEALRAGNLLRVARLLIYFFLFCHWVACLWWVLGDSYFNTKASFGASWTLRGFRSDTVCLPLSDIEDDRERAAEALRIRVGVEPGFGNGTEYERELLEVLAHNWQLVWCDPVPIVPGGPLMPSPAAIIHGDFTQIYLSSLYWSMTLVMKTAHIGPDTAYEKSFASVMVFVGSLVYIVLLSYVISMLTAYSKTNAVHRDHRQTVALFCRTRHLPRPLVRRWFQYISEVYKVERGFSTASVLQWFPQHLHLNTLHAVHDEVVHISPLFSGCDAAVVKILLHTAKPELFLAKTELVTEHIESNRLYILTNGVLHVTLASPQAPKQTSAVSWAASSDATAGPCASAAGRSESTLTRWDTQSLEDATRRSTSLGMRLLTPIGQLAHMTGVIVSRKSGRESRSSASLDMRGAQTVAVQFGARSSPPPPVDSSRESNAAGAANASRPSAAQTSEAARQSRLTATQALKSKLRSTTVIEKLGSILGFPDPFEPAKPSVYSATAWTKTQVLVFERRELTEALMRCPKDPRIDVCKTVEREYNKLMTRLKAPKEQRSNTVLERLEREEKTADLKNNIMAWKQDFFHPKHIEFLGNRVAELEARVDKAVADTTAMRKQLQASIGPIAKLIFQKYGAEYGEGRVLAADGLTVMMRRAERQTGAMYGMFGGDDASALAAAVLAEDTSPASESAYYAKSQKQKAQKGARKGGNLGRRDNPDQDEEQQATAAVASMLM